MSRRRGARRSATLANEARARIEGWLASVERVRPHEFDLISDDASIPPGALADSCMWCERVLSPTVSPYCEGVQARRSVHRAGRATADLLRHDYAAAGLRLTITESRNFLLIEVARESVDVLSLPEEARATAIRRVARRLFCPSATGAATSRTCLPPRLRLPARIDEGTVFNSNPRADPRLLGDSAERVDGGVRGGVLYFICYKREPHRVGFVNARQWFEPT